MLMVRFVPTSDLNCIYCGIFPINFKEGLIVFNNYTLKYFQVTLIGHIQLGI
jgi:hypothetical protein